MDGVLLITVHEDQITHLKVPIMMQTFTANN